MSKKPNLDYRSDFLVEVFENNVPKESTILEIGCGDGRNVFALRKAGYKDTIGIDKNMNLAIEDIPEGKWDVIFSMSTFFLIPPENNWVFEKIARMSKSIIITVEGEYTDPRRDVWGRNYLEVFRPFGFSEIYSQFEDVMNVYGVLRVLKRI